MDHFYILIVLITVMGVKSGEHVADGPRSSVLTASKVNLTNRYIDGSGPECRINSVSCEKVLGL